jgi:hypothetical protein
VTHFINDRTEISINEYVVNLPKLSDYYGNELNKPDLCAKTLHLFDSTGVQVNTHTYLDPTLTLTIPGAYTYYFSLDDYKNIISDPFEILLDPCSVTHFLNDDHDSHLTIVGLEVTLPEIGDYWS